MNFGIRWRDECLRDLERIYGNLETADPAVFTIDWRLARNPLSYTWEIAPGKSDIRLAWVREYLTFPAVYLSFRIVQEQDERYCLMLRARRANDPATS
jgi:hypothetical protein